jgi:hypothetical protein
VAAEMAIHAERWLRLHVAGIVLNRAVERYRAANENPLIRRASEISAAVAGTGDNPIARLSIDYAEEEHPCSLASGGTIRRARCRACAW